MGVGIGRAPTDGRKSPYPGLDAGDRPTDGSRRGHRVQGARRLDPCCAEGPVLFADHDPARDVLVLSAEVGSPPESGRLRLYELLLRYNHRWAETAGARMALDGEGGAAVLLLDLVAASTLDLPRLQAALAGFLDAARAWAEILARGPGGDDGAEVPFNPAMMGMIRG